MRLLLSLSKARLFAHETLRTSRIASFSSSSELVSTRIDEDSGVAYLIMNRLPVNSLSLEMYVEGQRTTTSSIVMLRGID